MRQFPVILIPPEVQRIALSKPVAPEFNPKLPTLPASASPDPIDTKEALSFTGGLILIVAIVSLVAKELSIMILIVGTIAIVLRVRLQFQTYKKRSAFSVCYTSCGCADVFCNCCNRFCGAWPA